MVLFNTTFIAVMESEPLKLDGVVKTLHLVRCCNFTVITTYLMYAEIIEKLHASNMELFTYPSNIEVFTGLSNLLVPPLPVKTEISNI